MNSTEQFHQRVNEGLHTVSAEAGLGGDLHGSAASNQYSDDTLLRVTIQDRGNEVSTNAELSVPTHESGNFQKQQGARLTQRTKNGTVESTEAVAKTALGEYYAADDSPTTVRREGYGQVELRNPRAKVLVAALAEKVIGDAQEAMTEPPTLKIQKIVVPSNTDNKPQTRRRRSMSIWS
ncbi:MAG TPA: hypothetical protein PJ984_00750 [Candidatus Saccharibacteria bacterium]|jgi:hypothetical protein|nr:hypothetical protein [Patescibacteria group bacterium]HMS30908.1 hypothetical protein [Candidatus Saccharibacteria bacterium]